MNIVTRLNDQISKDIIDKMFEFITTLDPEKITEEQATVVSNIIDMLDPQINEVFKKRVKRDLAAARKRRKEYRRSPTKRKRAARKYRRSAKGKKTLRKAKRFGKIGRTSTGKRKRVFIGPSLPKIQKQRKNLRKF